MAFQWILRTLIDQLARRQGSITPLLWEKTQNMYLQCMCHHWPCLQELVEMAVPGGIVGYHMYAAAGNQEVTIGSCDFTASL